MSNKKPNDIGDVLIEIALAVTPIIIAGICKWLQGGDSTE